MFTNHGFHEVFLYYNTTDRLCCGYVIQIKDYIAIVFCQYIYCRDHFISPPLRLMIFNQHILPYQLLFSTLRAFIDPVIVLSMLMLSFIYVIVHVCDLFCIEASLCMSFYHLLDWDSINRFNPPHLFTCLKSGPGFTT